MTLKGQKVQSTGVQMLNIDVEQADRRLDNYLISQFSVPKRLLYRLVRTGQVRVNGKRCRPNHRLKVGDQVRMPPIHENKKNGPIRCTSAWHDLLNNRILYEDEEFLIINKPTGIPVHGGSGVSVGLVSLLRSLRPNDKYLELVHRLDKGTSGCLILTKKPRVLRALHECIRQESLLKIYWALTKGQWKSKHTLVKKSLQKNVLSGGRRLVKVSDEGKMAITEFNVMRELGYGSLMKIRLHTGRTHQIRVHAEAQGHPIAGDVKYGYFSMREKQNFSYQEWKSLFTLLHH